MTKNEACTQMVEYLEVWNLFYCLYMLRYCLLVS